MALASAGKTQSEWAKENEYTSSYLSNLLAGLAPETDTAAKAWERIEAFTDEELRRAGVVA